ncbi:hydroxyisourate hydrolase [Kineococcus gynurae]|uniref:5-hydroxyisourate hydrolase n=1 Tax=Kineococcus gynurae TaxID=452979 RepID=A0ABV5LPF9_9ACTN
MSSLSTHVLDAATGIPAVGVVVDLSTLGGEPRGGGVTDADGRLRLAEDLPPGDYRIRFATRLWFEQQGRETFFPEVLVGVAVAPDRPHLHVPLLLSPFAYSTYRGS